jgi:hypothetical protein
MPVLFPVTSFLFALPVLGRVFRFVIPVANYVEHTEQPRSLRYQEAVLDTFDMLSPRFDRPLRVAEAVSRLEALAGTTEVVSERPLIVTGRR